MIRRPGVCSIAPLTALLVIVGLSLGATTPASAHEDDEGVVITVDDQRLIVSAAVPFSELGYLDTSGDGLLDTSEMEAQDLSASLVTTVRESVELVIDGETTQIIGAGVPAIGGGDPAAASPYAVLVLATGPYDGEVDSIDVTWAFSGPSTRVVLTHADGMVTGQLSDDGVMSFSLDGWSSAVSFFNLGVEHIQFGPDHLWFLLVLTLAAVGTTVSSATTWRTIKLVTAFTIGHAISLGLAYFEIVSISASIVEPAISLSIVLAALLVIRDLVRKEDRDSGADARPWFAALIGVVHGLGFASNLGTLGIAASQRVAALAAFNLGIDIAQTVVVLLVIGVLWISTRLLAERTVWLRFAGAAAAALVGLIWTTTRIVEVTA